MSGPTIRPLLAAAAAGVALMLSACGSGPPPAHAAAVQTPTPFPQPAPGAAPNPGPLTVPSAQPYRALGITEARYTACTGRVAVIDDQLSP